MKILTEIDIESENYPDDFETCLLKDISGEFHVGFLIKYGDDLENAEWCLKGKNEDEPFESITHFLSLKNY